MSRELDPVEVNVAIGDGIFANAFLRMPRDARGLVLFAHGSGSSRFSPRNAFVAGMLAEGRLASLLLDLLTPDEEKIDAKTAALRFDIGMLASRLVAATRWTRTQPALEHLQIGYFGASTGAAAALVAAAMLRDEIRAIVSRGGRPDLAGAYLSRVAAPTLLIVGGNDDMVIELNNQAARQMSAPHRIAIVPGATHLFEEPGTLATAARLAREWFEVHL